MAFFVTFIQYKSLFMNAVYFINDTALKNKLTTIDLEVNADENLE